MTSLGVSINTGGVGAVNRLDIGSGIGPTRGRRKPDLVGGNETKMPRADNACVQVNNLALNYERGFSHGLFMGLVDDEAPWGTLYRATGSGSNLPQNSQSAVHVLQARRVAIQQQLQQIRKIRVRPTFCQQ